MSGVLFYSRQNRPNLKKSIFFFLLPLFYGLLRLWWFTLRYTIIGDWRYKTLSARHQRIVFVLWHDEMFSLIPLHINQGIAAIVSQSKDGEILSRILSRSGFELARGSNSRGGLDALRQAMRQMKKGHDIVFTADGPRGPRHKAKTGPVYLAARTGAVLLPIRVQMRSAWKLRRAWDRFQIPHPWSHCEIHYGRPYTLPAGKMTEQDFLNETRRLEEIMFELVNHA